MVELIKSLYRRRNRDLIVVIMDPEDTSKPKEINLKSKSQVRWFRLVLFGGGMFSFLFVVLLILRWTAGGDARIRMELNQLADRVSSLSDSVEVRDQQLQQIRSTLTTSRQMDSSYVQRATRQMDRSSTTNTSTQNRSETNDIILSSDRNGTSRSLPRGSIVLGNGNATAAGSIFPAKIPVSGRITRPYAPAIGHYGTDIALREGTVLRNFAKGTVIASDWTKPYGYVVSIMHDDGHLLVYKHLTSSNVLTGDVLQKGDQIGIVGMAGTLSSGPHLHIELWKNGSHIDPMLSFIE